MKKKWYLFTAITVASLLCGCNGKNTSQNSNETGNEISAEEQSEVQEGQADEQNEMQEELTDEATEELSGVQENQAEEQNEVPENQAEEPSGVQKEPTDKPTDAEENDLPKEDLGSIEVQETVYLGEYLDDNGDSNLEIAKGEDGKYIVQIGIFRLTSLEDGVGELTADGMTFTATDAAGNPISGVITVKDDVATVTFTDSTWTYLENGATYEYIKSSETPNLWGE